MATITIPADYLEHARVALAYEIKCDGKAVESADIPEDRAMSLLVLQRSTQLLAEILDAEDELTVMAEADGTSAPIFNMLEGMIARLAGQLKDECVYGPLPVADMRPILDELAWAMGEAEQQLAVEAVA